MNTPYETHKLERNEEMLFGEDVKINIAGYVVIVEVPEILREVFNQSGLPILSPPNKTTTYSEPEKKAQTVNEELSVDIFSPSPMPEQVQESPPQKEEIQFYHDSSASPPRSSLSPPPEDLSPPEPISTSNEDSRSPPPTDLALLDALLTTLIFAEVKPTSLPRLVADLSHRMSNVHQDHIKSVLTATPCVGIVHRSGKDAAGKELSDEYYYIPESIPSPLKFNKLIIQMTIIYREETDIINLLVLQDLVDLSILKYIPSGLWRLTCSIIGNLLNCIHIKRKGDWDRPGRRIFQLVGEEKSSRKITLATSYLQRMKERIWMLKGPSSHRLKIHFVSLSTVVESIFRDSIWQIVQETFHSNSQSQQSTATNLFCRS